MVRHRDWRCGFAAIAVVACCVACSSAPGGAASPAAGARTAVATKSGTSGPALAEVTGFGGTVSTPTPAALGAMQAILISTPAARYGGVTLGGGGGIIVAELAGTPDPALDDARHEMGLLGELADGPTMFEPPG